MPALDLAALESRISGLSLADTDSYGHGPRRGVVLVEGGLGGPDAVRQLLGAIPEGFPRPILVRLQLDGGRYDRLVRQMERASALPVQLAEAGMSVVPGEVYFLPPGLLPAMLLRKVWATGLLLLFQDALLPRFVAIKGDATPGPDGPNVHTISFSWVHLLGYVVWNVLSLVVALPLDCIITRLITQRDTQAYAPIDAEDQRVAEDAEVAEDAPSAARADDGRSEAPRAAPAALVRLRPSGRPYVGAWDCFVTMLAEEGAASLTRGAGVALVALLLEHAAPPGQ